MKQYEEKLKEYISKNIINAEHLSFDQSCHSVDDACKASWADIDEFVKNICMITEDDRLICVIVKWEDRASTTRVGKLLEIPRPITATPEEILEKTWYPCGGTPSFWYEAVFLIDEKVMEKDVLYTWWGSDCSLVKIAPDEIVRVNWWKIGRLRK